MLGAADLLAAQWMLREEGSGTRSAFESALAAYGLSISSLHVALALPSNEAVRSARMAGPFAPFMSELVVASHRQAGLLAKANFQATARALHMLRHAERYKSKASVALQQVIRDSPVAS